MHKALRVRAPLLQSTQRPPDAGRKQQAHHRHATAACPASVLLDVLDCHHAEILPSVILKWCRDAGSAGPVVMDA